jgi:hypothetical protein
VLRSIALTQACVAKCATLVNDCQRSGAAYASSDAAVVGDCVTHNCALLDDVHVVEHMLIVCPANVQQLQRNSTLQLLND